MACLARWERPERRRVALAMSKPRPLLLPLDPRPCQMVWTPQWRSVRSDIFASASLRPMKVGTAAAQGHGGQFWFQMSSFRNTSDLVKYAFSLISIQVLLRPASESRWRESRGPGGRASGHWLTLQGHSCPWGLPWVRSCQASWSNRQ